MKIAQISPLYEAVPPKLYGGTERVVSYLTEGLKKQGHEVYLFASGDSITSAELISHIDQAIRLNKSVQDPLAHRIVQMKYVVDRAEEFDILHFHSDYFHFPFTMNLDKPVVTTLHGRLDIPDLQYVYDHFINQPVVSISNNQRKPLPQANWVGTVYHGLPTDMYEKGDGKGDYVAFLGRISPEKRVDRAIEIAKNAGIKIKIAAKVDVADRNYYHNRIEHLLHSPGVEFVGEIGEDEKNQFLGNARALLFPIDWPEPFGMVMIEAMACGTPVIAFNRGSIPEIIQHGKNGFIVKSIEDAINALNNINLIDRTTVRKIFEQRFSVDIMVNNYLELYKQLIHSHQLAKSINQGLSKDQLNIRQAVNS